MRKSVIAAAAAVAVASGAAAFKASAADLDFMPPPPPPPPVLQTWQGFYIGGHLGFGEGTSDFRQDVDIFVDDPLVADEVVLFSSDTFRSGVTPDGWLGGAQAGYNFQINSFVLGIEGDISFTDWGHGAVLFDTDDGDLGGPFDEGFARGTASTDIDFLASVRGRMGYAMDAVMIYGTGGVAWASAEFRAHMEAVDSDGFIVEEVSAKSDLDDFGLVAGGGLAWMVIPQTMSVGVEGLYYWFDKKKTLIEETVVFEGGEADVRATAELHNAWVIRGRADFHF